MGGHGPEQVMKKDADAEGEQREFELCFMAIRLFFGNNCLIPMMVRVFPLPVFWLPPACLRLYWAGRWAPIL